MLESPPNNLVSNRGGDSKAGEHDIELDMCRVYRWEFLPAATDGPCRAGASGACNQGVRSPHARNAPPAPQLTLQMTSPAQVLLVFSATSPRTWHSWRSAFAPVSCLLQVLLESQPFEPEYFCARSLIDHPAWPKSMIIEALPVDSNRRDSLPMPAKWREIACVLTCACCRPGLAFALSFGRRSPRGLIFRRFS